ncbi:probable protein phosphatase 2C 8 [Amaranthus tricolor]|uniref:probable protein phosphatase 2C 8 n=1 Tax=Amaranthus tricolor TaxID=29722 RepID=UPI0025847CAB|nr:probable protein phosphatase 2C 8 [Amaranthus tricolor]
MNKASPNSLSHGSISVIGRRRSMEDVVTVVPGVVHLEGDRPTPSYDFYAVYDGNGAYTVARKCKERLHHIVAEQFLIFGLDEWDRVMSSSFARVDEEFVKDEFGGITSLTDFEELVGSTALVVLVGAEEIVVANCGDSKAVLSCNGAAVTLSRDTKLKRPNEKTRPVIKFVEGNVTSLNNTHVLGNRESMEPYVIPAPEVTVHKRRKTDNFLVIASNGLWDVISNETACDIVRKCSLNEAVNRKVLEGVVGNYAAASAAMLVELALARGSKDNISVIVVELQHVTNANGNYHST